MVQAVPLLRRQRPILRSLFFLSLEILFMKSELPMTSSHNSEAVTGSVLSRRIVGSGSGSSAASLSPFGALNDFPDNPHGSSMSPVFASSPTCTKEVIESILYISPYNFLYIKATVRC